MAKITVCCSLNNLYGDGSCGKTPFRASFWVLQSPDFLTRTQVNYNGNYVYSDGLKGDYREATTLVDQFGIANAFGLSDMHGNVLEWCQDSWHGDYNDAPTDGSAWIEGRDSFRRVLRGGSWFNYPRGCRSAYRYSSNPDYRNYVIGFRVSCSAPRSLQ